MYGACEVCDTVDGVVGRLPPTGLKTPYGVDGVRKSANVDDRVTGGRGVSEKDLPKADGGRSVARGYI